MTEMKIRELKRKLANSKTRIAIEAEITNYQEAIDQGSKFSLYHQQRVETLSLELEKLK
jgi:hypothetical protein